MKYEVTKSKVLSSLIWKLMERSGTQGVQFLVTIILARLLLPEEFGLIVLVTIFLTVANVFVQSGFNTALIQRENVDEIDFSSVFYLSIFIASVMYIILFSTAPYIAYFFEEFRLIAVLRVISLTLFLGAFNSIQMAIIARNMQFKKLFISSLVAIIISGTTGITMAYANFGVWAIVGQQLANQIIIVIILGFIVKWRPRLLFSFERIKSLFSFGWKLLISSLIDVMYVNLRSILIGKMYSPAVLGFYNRGEQFPNLLVSNINGSIQSVMLPTLSSFQENKQRVKEIVRRSIVTSAFIVFPMMVGLAVIAEPLIKLLLTEKWLPAVPFLQIFCASYALWPIHTANLQAINALGRSDIYLKLEIIKKILGLAVLTISIPFGVYAIALGVLITGIISTFINAYPNLNLINYSFKEQWKDLAPSLFLSLSMGVSIYSIKWLYLSDFFEMTTQILIGIIFYISLAKIFHLECFIYLEKTLKNIQNNKKRSIPVRRI